MKHLQALLGTDREMARWRSCVNFVNLNMGVAVGRMYVEEYFGKDARENVSTVLVLSSFNFIIAQKQRQSKSVTVE